MIFSRVVFWKSFVFINFILLASSATSLRGQVRPRVLQAVDNAQRVTLKGNVHPLAASQNDRGAISDAQPIGRILLLLKRSDEQQAALSSFMEQQQDKSSPKYQQWLAPSEFGSTYGVADEDIQAVTQWLTQQGFQINRVYSSKLEIEFSGTAAQVRTAFGTDLRNFQVDGKTYVANSADPQIPAALAPVIAGIVSLNNFPRQSYVRRLGQFRRENAQSLAKPLFTFPSSGSANFYGLGPADFATIYNSAPLIASANDGTGQTIAIVSETNINLQDVQNFRQIFGLPTTFTAANIILNGEDPGITSTDEESEADLDVQWSGAVAPGATVQFVVSSSTPASAGVDLSALYIIERNLAGSMSESYGACETSLGTAGNAFYNSLWEQAAAQGITVALSSGDGGSAGCDDFNSEAAASDGLAVSGFSSTPFNVSVGGTDFDQMNMQSTYWNPTNNPTTGVSAKGYIPEIPWNESCAQLGLSGCSSPEYQNIVAGSGGPSSRYSKPSWQMGVTGMPNDSKRDQPDISLFASPGFNGSGYIVCQQDQTYDIPCSLDLNNADRPFLIIGGTSASSPSFAGVMALVSQYEAAHGGSQRQGNANYTLYALAKKVGASCTSAAGEAAGCIFNDVTHGNSGFAASVGTNSVPCHAGTPNCNLVTGTSVGVLVDATKNEAWVVGAGYDTVTGLGSLNIQNLAQNWASVSTVATSTTLALTPATGITHGPAENVGVSITVTPSSGTATGVVSLVAHMPDGSTRGADDFTLASGAIAGAKTQNLPGGTYTVTAHYAGDGTNAPSDSAPVSVTVAPETSQTFIVVPSFTAGGTLTSGNASSVTYGSSYIIRMYVTDKTGAANPLGAPSSTCDQTNLLTCPTGSVTLMSGGNPLDGGTFTLNNAGYTRDIVPTLQGGTYSLLATYGGDSSFNGSTSAAHAFTVTPTTTQTQMDSYLPSVQEGQTFQLEANVTSQVTGTNGVAYPSGTVTFYDGNTMLPGPVQITQGQTGQIYADIYNISFSTPGPHTLSAKYSGDNNYGPSTSSTVTSSSLIATSITQTVSGTNINYGQSITVTAVMTTNSKGPAITGQIFFEGGFAFTNVSTTPGVDANGNQTLTITGTTTPQGSESIYSFYQGDANYASSSSAFAFITVNIPDFSLGPANGLSVVPAVGQAGSGQITITPVSQTPSSVSLSLSGGVVISGYTIALSPQQVNLNGAPATATISLTLVPGAPASAVRARLRHAGFIAIPERNWRFLSLMTGLGVLFLLGVPARRRKYRAALFVSALCVVGVVVGCGGGSGGAGGGGGGGGGGVGTGGGGSGQVPTTIALTTSNVKVAQNAPFVITATVTSSKPATGSVTFYNFGAEIASGVVVNGQVETGQGYINNPGLYQITASYSGDSSTLGSTTSAALTQEITGTMPLTIQANTGNDFHYLQVTVGVQ
jgi:subtilase family serine protease